MELDPNHLDARFGLVAVLHDGARLHGRQLRQGVRAGRRDQEARSADGASRAALHLHASEEDRRGAQRVPRRGPRVPEIAARALSTSASSYIVEKNYKAAADEFETALKLDADVHAGVLPHRTASPSSRSTNYARGEEALRKYLAYTPKDDEPSHARAHYWLGQIYEKQGKKAEAKASFATSLKLNPAQKDVAEALKRVS